MAQTGIKVQQKSRDSHEGRTGSGSLARAGGARGKCRKTEKACVPFRDTGRQRAPGKGMFEGEAATGWRPGGECPLRRRKLRASPAEMRPDGDPEGSARCDAGSYGHRQQRCDRMATRRDVPVATQEATGIASRDATGWRPGGECPLRHRKLRASAAALRGPFPPKGCSGRYALRGRPARWAKPMRAWVSLAAVKSAWCRPGRGASSTTSMPAMLRPCRQRSMSSRA